MPHVIHRRGRTMNAENHTEILLARGRRLQELPGAPLPVAAISTSPDSSDGLRLTCARTLDRRAERRRMPFDAASRASRITPRTWSADAVLTARWLFRAAPARSQLTRSG
jgi:hypothetical protein